MNSSRILPILAAVSAVALASYITVVYVIGGKEGPGTVATTPSSVMPSDAGRDILSYVPADTVYFFGGLEPAPLKNMLDIFAPEWGFLQNADFKQELPKDPNSPPAVKMLTGLFAEYMQAFKDPKAAPGILGVGDELDAVFYSVGTTPVIRIKLADMNAFNRFISNAETMVQVAPVLESHGTLEVRTYSFSTPEDSTQESEDIKLAINVDNNYALLTLLTPLENPETRNVILGLTKPSKPLGNTTLLSDLKSKHGFHPAYLGYINHEEIMKGMTTPEDNEFGRMLGALIKKIKAQKAEQLAKNQAATDAESATEPPPAAGAEPQPENPLASIQTEACRTELLAITKLWPRTIFGYTEFNLKKKPRKMTARMLVENTDAAFMQQLQKLRGFIPASLRTGESKPVIGLGFGFNIDELTPVVSQMITAFTQQDYHCPSLAEMKQSLLTSNPMMALGMMTGMAAGVQGISVTVLDVDGELTMQEEQVMPDIRSIDALITLSAKDPQRLLMLAANFMQGMPPIQLPADGTPIDLPVPLPIPNLGPIKLAQKGNHIVAYIGEKSALLAQKMADDPVSPTGLFAFNMDFGKYMSLISDIALSNSAAQEQLTAQDKTMLEEMKKFDMQLVETFDIEPQGMVFEAKMTMQ